MAYFVDTDRDTIYKALTALEKVGTKTLDGTYLAKDLQDDRVEAIVQAKRALRLQLIDLLS